jgi:GNAT superfamily N-acetyltransferase
MSAAVQVVRAGPDHVDAATRLFLGYLGFYEKAVSPEAAFAFIDARLRQGDSVIFLAEVDGQALGFMQLYPAYASLSLAPSWILNDLFVVPEGRGQGIGSALMHAARELGMANGAAEIFLQTARTNLGAQSLYETLGYQRDDEFLVYTLTLPIG